MDRFFLRRLRRCRVFFALALCAWLGLATTVFAQADCCAGMRGMATATHHHDAPAPAGSVHVDCACAHTAAVMPAIGMPVGPVRFSATAWQAPHAMAPDLAHAPPLRPPLA